MNLPSDKFNAEVLAKIIGLAVIYVLLAKVVLAYFSANGIVSIIWPASGLALAVLLIGGRQYAWGVLLGAFVANVWNGTPVGISAFIGFSNTLEALAGLSLLTRVTRFDPSLESSSSYLYLLFLGGVIGALVGALIGSTTLLLSGYFPIEAFAKNFAFWWMGDAMGIIIVTPLILVWSHTPFQSLKSSRWLEAVMLFSFSLLATQIIFLGWFHDLIGEYAKGFLMFLFASIAAIRFDRHGVLLIILMTASLGLFGAVNGKGYFAADIIQTQLTGYWLYMTTLSFVGMMLACYIHEIRNTQEALIEKETQLRLSEQQLKQSLDELKYQKYVLDKHAIVAMTDVQGRITYANDLFCEISGYSRDELIGQDHLILNSGYHPKGFFKEMYRSLATGHVWQNEICNRAKDGHLYWVDATIAPFLGDDGKPVAYISIRTDITPRKLAEEKSNYLALYDPLTSLPNRRLLGDRLDQALASAARRGTQGALLFIDLDHFKTINDTLGHDMGDRLLQQVGERLTAFLRQGDTVARLGGDEFVVMLENLSAQDLEAGAEAEMIAGKILLALNHPFQLEGNEYRSGCSIGLVLFCDQNHSHEELLKQADIAMYQAKKEGRNALRFFNSQMQDTIIARVSLEKELGSAIEKHQLQLYYQVQIDSSGRPIGAEALIRWLHPERGLISPAHFIPLAEETRLILPIGLWVLESACAQIKTWQSAPKTRDLRLAVNVSAKQFEQSNFVMQVLDIIARTGADPSRLKLELTESLMVDNVDSAIEKMSALKAKGISFSLDDFGTGFSSLSYLKRLPLDQLKIDQSFVHDVMIDSNDAAIVRTVIALGQSLGLAVIAEGVETEEQRNFLAVHGCLYFQGYLFSKPLPLIEFEHLLTKS